MKPTSQQESVLEWATKGKGHLNLVARAGCGKTSTLLMVAEIINGQGFLGAFNKAIAEELKAKLISKECKNCEAATMHSIGLRAWKKVNPHVQVEGSKVYQILYHMQEKKEIPEQEGLIPAVAKAVSFAKQALLIPPEKLETEYSSRISILISHYGLDDEFPFTGETIELVRNVHRQSFEVDSETVDFDDMIVAPIIHDAPIPGYNWVFIDEAQDTNAARQELALRMLRKGSRLVAVGDERQAIYGFTGAFSNAMELISDKLGSKSLPLNLTFRCSQSVVRYAQKIVPDIFAAPQNPEGAVTHVEDFERWSRGKFGPTEVILCRNNKPIVELAYRFIREGRGCRVEGRDIGQGLLKFAKKFKEKSLMKLRDLIEDYQDRETRILTSKKQSAKIQPLEDKCQTLQILLGNLTAGNKTADITDLGIEISNLFGDTVGAQKILTLSSIHKSKGREWDKVNLLGRNLLMPSFWAKEEWQQVQEQNLLYVAITRAKTELIEIDLPPKSRGE